MEAIYNRVRMLAESIGCQLVGEPISPYAEKTKISSAQDVYNELAELALEPQEHMYVLSLNNTGEIINKHLVSIGTVSHSLAHPREIFRNLITDNARDFILVHNHPSGSLDPSDSDQNITRKMKEAGIIIGIELLDHVIISARGHFSFREDKQL